MRCAHCGTVSDSVDSYCRRCGAALNRTGLPTVVSRSLLPVPWTLAKGPVVRGVAALLVGTMVELARREVVRRTTAPDPTQALASLMGGVPAEPKRGRFPWSKAPRGEYEIVETVVQRRVRFFRR
jgi:hypothetical protein